MEEDRNYYIELIINVLQYRDGDYYIGSLETSKLYNMLGVRYGDLSINLYKEIKEASLETLKRIVNQLDSYITYMEKYPIQVCPCCGSKVRTSKFLIDPNDIKKED